MRKGEQAAADGGAVIAKWDPPLERHCVHRIRAAAWLRTVPHQKSMRKSASSVRRWSCGGRRCALQLFVDVTASAEGMRADIQGNRGRKE